MCIYESGPGSPHNDGLPFAVALFSWSTRMLSYSEPSLYQKTRALKLDIRYFLYINVFLVLGGSPTLGRCETIQMIGCAYQNLGNVAGKNKSA